MSHIYPIAVDAHAALNAADIAARTRYEAEAAAKDAHIESLATEWLTPSASEISAWLARAEESPGHGFVQQYEDADGNPVFAVTYWKLVSAKGSESKALPPKRDDDVNAPVESDDTDDLYFKTKKKSSGRKRHVDKNQLDLFGSPKTDDA